MSQIQLGDAEMPKYTRVDIENAGADARFLMENSKIIPHLVAVDIITRRIFLHVHSAMVREINRGWDVQHPELVIKSLGMSAQEKAVAEPATATELHMQLFESVIPVLDIFTQMEQQSQNEQHDEKTDPPVSGDETGPSE